jgi:hypothetical protein
MPTLATSPARRLAGLDTSAAPPRVVASFGMGVDSAAMLVRWMSDPSSRDFDLSELAVVTAMVGNEFSSTLEVVSRLMLPRFRSSGVRFIQIARAQRKTTRAGDGIVVLDDSRCPGRLYGEGVYTLAQEMLSAGTIPQLGGARKCSVHAKGDALDPVIARITEGRPYRHAIGFEETERARADKDRLFNTDLREGFYPLQDWKWTRADCQQFLVQELGETVPKSACGYCPYAATTENGRARLVERYRDEPAAAIQALFLEYVARSLNPAQTLIANSSVADLIKSSGLRDVQDRFEALLDETAWALYEVRRLIRPGRDGKLGLPARSIRVIDSGSRQAMLTGLAALPGVPTIGADSIARHILRSRDHGGVDHLFVAAPVGAEAKQRPGFEQWWQQAVGEGLF